MHSQILSILALMMPILVLFGMSIITSLDYKKYLKKRIEEITATHKLVIEAYKSLELALAEQILEREKIKKDYKTLTELYQQSENEFDRLKTELFQYKKNLLEINSQVIETLEQVSCDIRTYKNKDEKNLEKLMTKWNTLSVSIRESIKKLDAELEMYLIKISKLGISWDHPLIIAYPAATTLNEEGLPIPLSEEDLDYFSNSLDTICEDSIKFLTQIESEAPFDTYYKEVSSLLNETKMFLTTYN